MLAPDTRGHGEPRSTSPASRCRGPSARCFTLLAVGRRDPAGARRGVCRRQGIRVGRARLCARARRERGGRRYRVGVASLAGQRADSRPVRILSRLCPHTLYEGLDRDPTGAPPPPARHARVWVCGAAPEVLATHWAATGREPREVTEWAGSGATSTNAALSPEDAVHWYRTALDAIDDASTRRRRDSTSSSRSEALSDGPTPMRSARHCSTLLHSRNVGDDDALFRAALANNRGGASRAGAVDRERVDVLERAIAVAGSTTAPSEPDCSRRWPSSCRKVGTGSGGSSSPTRPWPALGGWATK